MNALLSLVIVAAAANLDQGGRHPDAVEVFRCLFDEEWDRNFDGWPDRWARKRGVGFPRYIRIGIVDDAQIGAKRALKIDLDGGGATVSSPPIHVDARFSYVLESKLKTHGLKHDQAYLSVTFYDADRKPLETIYSKKFTDVPEWGKLHLGPFSPNNSKVEMAVISLHVRPGEKQDLTGWAMFDDVWFARLPRMNLRTNSQYNVYTDPNDISVSCQLSGIVERDPEIKFELLDASGGSIARAATRLDAELIAQKSSKASDLLGTGGKDKPAGYEGTSEWKPPIEDFGFYRVRVTMRSPTGIMHERRISLAVIRPLGKPVRGEFGWGLPGGDDPLSLEALQGLLPHVGINWLKFPVWYDHETEDARGDKLMLFAERLGSKGVEMVGMLDVPPAKLRENLGGSDQISAANVFSSDPTLWFPSLDPVMTRLSLRIRWWQLGGDHDSSFVGYPNLAEKITEIKKQLYRFGQEVHMGIGWKWIAETLQMENPPWEFLTLSADPPLTGPEMEIYLKATAQEKALRWALVEPLPRSHYSMETRSRDLVDQMMSAKIQEADGIFIPNPFSTEHGLMNDDGTPGELLLPWRTTALVLGGSRYLGSIRMPNGSHNHIYTRNGEAVMVVWNERPVKEIIYLGEDVQQVDIWGRMAKPEQEEHRQIINVSPLPTFITGINEDVTRWRMTVKFDKTKMPSVFGTAHQNGVYMKNFFPQGAGGEINVMTPKVWSTYPRKMSFKLAVGEELIKPFNVELDPRASSGREDVRIDFSLNVDRRYRFSVYRDLEVGLGDVVIHVTTKIDKNGALIVTQRMTNTQDKMVDFKCLLHAPNRRRQSNQVFRLGRGQDIKIYRYPNGKELIGKEIWLRCEEIGSLRILNYRFTVAE